MKRAAGRGSFLMANKLVTGYFYKNVKNFNKFVKVRGYKVLGGADVPRRQVSK